MLLSLCLRAKAIIDQRPVLEKGQAVFLYVSNKNSFFAKNMIVRLSEFNPGMIYRG